LLDGGFYSPRANGANLLRLIILIVDNAVTMLLKVLAEVVSLRAFTVSKQGSGSIDLTLPEQDFGLLQALEGTTDLGQVLHQMKQVLHLPALGVGCQQLNDMTNTVMPIS